MKRKIFTDMCIAAILCTLLCCALLTLGFYNFLKAQTFETLASQSLVIKDSLKFENYSVDFINSLKTVIPDTRITLIKNNGTVLYDSWANAASMENHLSRPEVQQALKDGKGSSVRFSSTLSQNTYYYALMLDNGEILRLSKTTHSVFLIFYESLPTIIFVLIAAFVLCILISKRLTRRILQPLEKIGDLDNTSDLYVYDEFMPFINKITAQNTEIAKQLASLKSGRDTLNAITANMREGLILLDKDKNILSVNRSAIAFLNAKDKDYTSLNILSLCRIPLLISNIDRALLKESRNFEIEISGNHYEVYLNPVFDHDDVKGAIVLLFDITQKKKVEKMKQDFSANVSHELRTPLTAISGFAEMLKSGMVDDKEDIKNFSSLIYNESRRLVTLADDILKLSQIEENPDVKFEDIDIMSVFKNTVGLLSPQIAQKQLDISFECNTSDTFVFSNGVMMQELIYNLFENAVKYNKQCGKIKITIEKTGHKTAFSICDTGIGIPAEHQPRVFERFYRVDKGRSKATGGTGLGLSIVKHIVEYHKGKITLESKVGVGTKITVII